MTDIKDYAAVDVPDPSDKPYDEWHYTERRAYLLDMALKRGSPKRINQTRMSERFDCAQSTIHDDIEAIGESLGEHLGTDAIMRTQAVFNEVVDSLMSEEDWRAQREAFKTVMEWNEWLEDRGVIEKAAEQHEIMHKDASETDDYRIVEDEDAVIDAEYSVVGDDDDDGDDVPDYEPKDIPELDE